MPTKKTGGSHNGHAATCDTMEPTRTSGSNLMSPTKVLNDVEAAISLILQSRPSSMSPKSWSKTNRTSPGWSPPWWSLPLGG